MSNWKLHKITSIHLLKYFETREWKNKAKQKMIVKEYKQYICKKKTKSIGFSPNS